VNHAVKITVAGQRLAVRTSADAAYLRELAEFVTAKIDEVRAPGRTATTQSLALLAAMNIADELYQLREHHTTLKRQVRERLKRILRYLDREAEFTT
jgi:cell division protein ZapA